MTITLTKALMNWFGTGSGTGNSNEYLAQIYRYMYTFILFWLWKKYGYDLHMMSNDHILNRDWNKI